MRGYYCCCCLRGKNEALKPHTDKCKRKKVETHIVVMSLFMMSHDIAHTVGYMMYE